MSWSFKPGDRVVCVNAKPFYPGGWSRGPCPMEGEVYTVQRLATNKEGRIVLCLVELKQSFWRRLTGFPGFRSERFRPVRTTSIESLRVHLNTIPANRSVDA